MSNNTTSTINTQSQEQEKQPGFWNSSLRTVRYTAEGFAEGAHLTAVGTKTLVTIVKSAAKAVEELGDNSEEVKNTIQGFGRSIHAGMVALEGYSLRAVNSALPNGQKMSISDWEDTATRRRKVFYATAGLDENGNPINDPEDSSVTENNQSN